jgi:hypothetical protein
MSGQRGQDIKDSASRTGQKDQTSRDKKGEGEVSKDRTARSYEEGQDMKVRQNRVAEFRNTEPYTVS